MAATSTLQEFNKSSAKVGHFIVQIAHGKVTQWEYEDKKTKQQVKANKYECILVGENPEIYMYGFVRGSPKEADDAAKKYKDGNVYKLSKTILDTWTAVAYISSPKQFRVNMAKSILTALPASSVEAKKMPQAPVPPRTVAETVCITTNKCCDVLALVKSATNKRQNRAGEDIIDCVIIDDSMTDSKERATLFLSVWGKKVLEVENSVGRALAFFNLTIKMDGENRLVNHYADAPLRAPPACPKTTHLQTTAEALLEADNTVLLSAAKEWIPHEARDVSGPQPLCCCAFLDYTMEEPTANMPPIVQVPWLQVEEPNSDDNVTVSGGSRLWLVPKTRDASGSVRIGCPHRIALELAGADNQEQFERMQAEETLGFPLFVHARISRTVKTGSAQTGAEEVVRHTLEEVMPVCWKKTEAPNASFQNLLAILNNLPPHDECIQFAFLKDLREDPHYGFHIDYDGVPGNKAAYAAVLVESVTATQTTPCGDGFKAETPDVRDVANVRFLAPESEIDILKDEVTYKVVSFSGLIGIVKLDPPRGKKSRFAVLLVNEFKDRVLEMHKAEYVEPEDAAGAVECFQRLRQLCKMIRPSASAKRSHAESSNFVQSPIDLKKCRTLKAVPTDGSLDGTP